MPPPANTDHRVATDRRPELLVVRLGTVDYAAALVLQERLRDARIAGAISDVLLLLEHNPVYTRGRRSEPSELSFGVDWYREQGIELHDVDRGGKTTYHGPGQIVGYPIVDTAVLGGDIVRMVAALEKAIIDSLSEEGVPARRDPAGRGVWASGGKIGSIGLHVTRGVTTHGFAVNIDCDLRPFGWIKPCGLDDPITSLAVETGRGGLMRCFGRRVAYALAKELGLKQRLVSRERLLTRLDSLALELSA